MCQFWEDMFKEIEKNDRLIADNDRLIAKKEQLLLSSIQTVMKDRSWDVEQSMDYLGFAEQDRPYFRKLLNKAGVSVGASA